MNRRGFLSLLAPAAALIVAPELLLPKRTFFLPPVGGWRDDYAAFHQRAYQRAWNNLVNPPVLYDGPISATEIIARNNAAMFAFANSKLADALAPGLIHHAPGFFLPLT